MTLDARALGPSFVAEVSGVDFSRPIDAATLAGIVSAMDRYGVCVFRATGLTDESHIAFSRQLGKLEHAPRRENEQATKRESLLERALALF